MRKKSIASLVRQLSARRVALSEQRDLLRNLIEEAEALDDQCTRALDALDDAVDALSELL